MSDNKPNTQAEPDLGLKLVYWLTVAMVLAGLINMTPGIPGYDDLAESLTGVKGATFRKFPFEWFYPSFFALMMLIVALKHSMWRSWADRTVWRRRSAVHGCRPCRDGGCDLRNLCRRDRGDLPDRPVPATARG